MAHIHNVVDTDVHYKIDGITRTITNINETKRELVQGDHNSERFTFEIPRYVDNHDFTDCNMVQVHYSNLDKLSKVRNTDVYIVDDLSIKEDDPNTVMFSWLISGNATKYVGTLNFSIRFACVSDNIVKYAWNTTTFKGINILESLDNSETIIENNADAIVALRNDLMKEVENIVTPTVEDALTAAKESGEFDGPQGEQGIPGEKGDKGDQGDTGDQGEQGIQGDTGKTAYDYAQEGGYTGTEAEFADDINPDTMRAELNTYIAKELAERGQLKPEFANNVSECTDTSKLYVLPDGYIWAYMTKTVTTNPTNQIRESIKSDGTQYVGDSGEDGYKVECRLDSTGAEKTGVESYAVTGFIPCTVNDVIRTKNIKFDTTATNSQIYLYNESFDPILRIAGGSNTNSLASILNSDGNVEGSIAQSTNTLTAAQKSSIAYIRIAGLKFGDSAVVTLNEPLEATTTTTTAWHNTGHAFVPADYEDRIVDLEEKSEKLEDRIDELVVSGNDTPTYVAQEAKRVAEIVQANRTVGSLTFTAMSDPHIAVDVESDYGLEDNLTSCRDAGLGLLTLQKHFKLDFAAMLGDYTAVGANGTIAQVKKDISYFSKCMADGVKGIPSVWCTGNHDINYGANTDRRMTEDEMYAYVTGNNNGTTQDGYNIGRNYGYIDFENQKIRCVYLNTVDALDYPDNTDGTADDAMEITAVQAQWLVDVGLDFGDKPTPTEWGVVLLSHHCLCQFPPVTAILTAYKDGESGSTSITTNGITTAVNYNFASANRGEIICAIHGHDHNFTYRRISSEKWYEVTEANAWLWSICIPNMDTTRDNEKAENEDVTYRNVFGEFDSSGNPVYYPKTQGTAKSTSFCVITIDRKNQKVHAIAYGAGTNREISYKR